MEDVLSKARLVADSEASVFIYGESGTGKELIARAIHNASRRRDQPFVAINCGAIPEQLLESELFGHVKGSFTGAVRDHKGLFQTANKGTLFLDEIGDMPVPLQVKLLRVLQERHVRPVGSTQSFDVDVRVISATHRNIEAEMAAGNFRDDLYYRLNVVALHLPPLAERREDIPLLANHFLTRLAEKYSRNISGFAPEAIEALVSAPWPGNVRQLYNVVEQAVALATTPLIPGDARPAGDPASAKRVRFVRGRAAQVRARVSRADPAHHRRQRHAGGAAREAQPHRVLQASAAPSARSQALQEHLKQE